MKVKTIKNPLEDKKWLKEFSEELKKDISQAPRKKVSSGGWTSEINCRQEDIGEPNYPKKKNVPQERKISQNQSISKNQFSNYPNQKEIHSRKKEPHFSPSLISL